MEGGTIGTTWQKRDTVYWVDSRYKLNVGGDDNMYQNSDRLGDRAYWLGMGEEQCSSCDDKGCSDQNFFVGQLFEMAKEVKKTWLSKRWWT